MKKPSDHIFRLIHAMTPAEKRYFKRHFASEQSVLTQLFDFINKMKSYNEQSIKQSFEENVARNLKVYKVQLFDLLLDSLQAFGSKKNIKTKIRRGIEEVDILLEKQLYDLAGDRLKKLKTLCLQYEEFTYLIELAYKEFFVHHITIDQIGISEHHVFQEVEHYLQKMKEHNELTLLGHQLMDKRRKISLGIESIEKSYFENILINPTVKKDSVELPFQTKLTQNTILSFVAVYLEDKALLEKSRRNNVELFDEFPHFKKTMAFRYMAVLRNYLNYAIEEKDYQLVPDIIKKARTYTQKNPNMEVHLIHFYYAEVQMRYNCNEFEQIGALEPLIKDHLKKFNIQRERIAMLNYFYFLFYAFIQRKNESIDFYLKELEETNNKLGRQYTNYIYLLKMIGALEEEEEEVLEKILQKAKKAELPQSKFWECSLELFKHILQKPFQKKAAFTQILEKEATFENDALWKTFKFHRLDEWLQAHQNRQSLSEWMLLNKKSCH